MNFPSSRFLLGALFSAWLALATGCGGGGGGGSAADDGNQPVPVGGNQVAGPADPVQDALTDVGDTTGDAPVIGDTSAALLSALVALLDAPDGLASGFQSFLTSQNPDDLIAGGDLAGDALLSFAAGLSETLIQLTEEGQAIPGSENLLPLLTQLQVEVQDGITGQTDGGDLTAITDLLVQIAGELDTLSGQVPSQVADAPLVGDLLTALGTGADDLSIILDATGRLDGDDTSAALVDSFENLLTSLSGSLPGDANSALTGAVGDATVQFENGLAVVLNPLFQALRGVLAPVTGETSPLAPVLGAGFAGDFSDFGGEAGFGDLLAGGGTGSGGTQIPLLSDLLSGLPVLGDVLAGLMGGEAAGGLDTLSNLLANGGTGNVPLLGDVLQGVPALGGADPASLPLLGDLLTALLSLDGDGVPVISDILDSAGGTGTGFDSSQFSDIIDGLLPELFASFGGQDANGGFLSGAEGLPVIGGIISGLLGSILGLLGLI
ncbi:hypothetical protein [Spectribacter hydrogenoxidans]|uniref:Collagen, middle region n=1 Tax=Spectribacter hydrogenoxidans TaxID=3075608 RepID=A0ABU3C040_9GAMM|nr:hypothetical protein [Salinisphaera sp. W335]MDT0634936.1 hypothetical protein [Salinisphaera sp. W335]